MSNFGEVRVRDATGTNHADPNAAGQLPVFVGNDTVPVHERSVLSTSNNSTTPLAISATFTGLAELCEQPQILVQSFSDAPGTLFIDFSIDGSNWDSTYPVSGYVCAANVPEVHRAVVGGRYYRLRYVNGGVVQTVFRLASYKGNFGVLSAALNQPIGLDADATLTRSTFPWLDTARGLTTGFRSTKKFGSNSNIGTTYSPVSQGGVYRTPQASGATTLRVKAGGNANDTAAGSGARSIELNGLDENFNEVTEVIATNGALASASTTTTFTRLFRMFVKDSGTYATSATGSHAGNIVVENTAGTQDWATIDAIGFPHSQSEIGAYSIATGQTGYVKLGNVSIDSGKTINLIFFSRTNIQQTAPPYDAMRAQSVISGVSGGSIEAFGGIEIPFGPYVGPTDIGFMAQVSAGTADVSVEFEIFVLDE